MSKRTDSPGLGSLKSGALTALSLLVVTGSAAAVGVVIAREFGRTEETDGLLAAYGVFIMFVVAAQAIRMAILPQVARAREEGRLAGEIAGSALALAAVAAPLVLVGELGTDVLASLLTGNDSVVAKDTAAGALRWMLPAACLHLFAALAASGLAALDDYGTAALAYAVGSVAGLALILARAEPDGIVAVAWGVSLNGAIALVVTVGALAVRASRAGMPRRAAQPTGTTLGRRLRAFAVAASLPLAVQLIYVICLPFASRLGAGAATSFVYAYLAASALVTVTASSLGLVTSVPLTRVGLKPALVTQHVGATSWISFAVVGGCAGVLVVSGADLVGAALGPVYGDDVGAEIGRLVALLATWIVATVGIALTFPLVFIGGRTRWLPIVAIVAVVGQVPLALAGSAVLGLEGLALSLAPPTWFLLAVLLSQLHALGPALRRLLTTAMFVGLLAALAFVPTGLVFGPYVAGVLGIGVYIALLAALRSLGLRASWRYLRSLA